MPPANTSTQPRGKHSRQLSASEQMEFDLDTSIPYLIYRIANRLNQNIHDRLKPAGISLTKWRLLSSLRSRGRSTISALAACTVMKHAVVSRILSEMEQDGFVTRETCTWDKRQVWMDLTDEGRALFDQAHDIAVMHRNEALRGLSREEIDQLIKLLHRIQANVGIGLE